MKRAARNVLCLILLCLLCCAAHVLAQTQPTSAPAATAERNVFLAGSPKDYWLAVVQPTNDANRPVESTIYYRPMAKATFSVVARLNDRVVSLGRWSARALVLTDDGQWMTVWPGGSSIGTPLPQGGNILALAADDESIWALATYPGGLKAALAATRLTTTGPATAAATTTAVATTQAAPSKVVLFELKGQAWLPRVELPAEQPQYRFSGASLLVTSGRVIAAIAARGGESVLFDIDKRTGQLNGSDSFPGASVTLLEGARSEPLALVRTGNAARLVSVDDSDRGVDLQLPVNPAAAIGSSLGYLRQLSVDADNKVLEQRLTWDGKPVGSPDAVKLLAAPDAAPPWANMLNVAVIAMLVVTIMASYRQRDEVRDTMARRDRPRAARFWVRISAATVDVLPVLIGGFVYWTKLEPDEIVSTTLLTTAPGIAGFAVYLLHTTVSELIFRRTLGKWIFGLAVVDLHGERPKAGAILIRNALRVVDIALMLPFLLPILLVLFSPLGQRAGDAAAGTVVIDLRAPKMTDEPEEE
jgi:uncharacterized RDD family membrane protein YckC